MIRTYWQESSFVWKLLEFSSTGRVTYGAVFDNVPYHTPKLFGIMTISSLDESGLDGFTIILAVGLQIVSLCKTWKPISNMAVYFDPKHSFLYQSPRNIQKVTYALDVTEIAGQSSWPRVSVY
jgi:hypothetical protein